MNIHPAFALILATTLALFPQRARADGAPTDGLIHQWHLDETSGTTAFDSIGTWHFTLSGNFYHSDGFIGSNVGFQGKAYMSTGLVDFTSLGTTFTLSFWTLLDGLGKNPEGLLTLGSTYLVVKSSGKPAFSISNTSSESSVSINDQRWHLITIVVNAGNEMLFVDSVGKGVANYASRNQSALQLGIGGQSYLYTGKVDEVSIYNRALSPAEIAQAAAVPEPSAALLFIGALGAFISRRRRVGAPGE